MDESQRGSESQIRRDRVDAPRKRWVAISIVVLIELAAATIVAALYLMPTKEDDWAAKVYDASLELSRETTPRRKGETDAERDFIVLFRALTIMQGSRIFEHRPELGLNQSELSEDEIESHRKALRLLHRHMKAEYHEFVRDLEKSWHDD